MIDDWTLPVSEIIPAGSAQDCAMIELATA
jgi:hypothetical protein